MLLHYKDCDLEALEDSCARFDKYSPDPRTISGPFSFLADETYLLDLASLVGEIHVANEEMEKLCAVVLNNGGQWGCGGGARKAYEQWATMWRWPKGRQNREEVLKPMEAEEVRAQLRGETGANPQRSMFLVAGEEWRRFLESMEELRRAMDGEPDDGKGRYYLEGFKGRMGLKKFVMEKMIGAGE